MERGIVELMAGYRRDPAVGPLVMLGIGGSYAEAIGRCAFRMAPLSTDDALEMAVEIVHLLPQYAQFDERARHAKAIAEVVTRLSWLARAEAVLEAEINPLMVNPDRVVAVDALLRIARPTLAE
jgi:hypothetical protein